MKLRLSPEDAAFREAFETGRVSTEQFNQRAHVRLAYACLVAHDPETAGARMRSALQAFLRHHGIAPEARAAFVEPDTSPIPRYPS